MDNIAKKEQIIKTIIDKIAQAVLSSLGSWVNDIDTGKGKYVVTTHNTGIIHEKLSLSVCFSSPAL